MHNIHIIDGVPYIVDHAKYEHAIVPPEYYSVEEVIVDTKYGLTRVNIVYTFTQAFVEHYNLPQSTYIEIMVQGELDIQAFMKRVMPTCNIDEVKQYVNELGAWSDAHNAILQQKFGCQLYTYYDVVAELGLMMRPLPIYDSDAKAILKKLPTIKINGTKYYVITNQEESL